MRMRERSGSLLLDALLAIVIFGAVVAAFGTGIIESQRGAKTGGERMRATLLAEEGIEAVRSIRNISNGFSIISSPLLDQDYGVQLSNTGMWLITSSPTTDDVFTRTIRFTNPNMSDNERYVTSSVTWNSTNGADKSVVLGTFLTNWHTHVPQPDWSQPILIGSITRPDEARFEKIAVSGNYAFIAESKEKKLFIYDVSNLTAPLLVKTISDMGKSYDIAIRGNYLYLGTDDTDKELKVLDISDPPNATCCEREVNFPSNKSIYGISITGTGLLVAREFSNANAAEVYCFDIGEDPSLGTISSPPVISDSAVDCVYDFDSAPRSAYAIAAAGAPKEPHLYVATNYAAQELTVISSTGSKITGGGDADENTRGTAVAIFLTGAYVGVTGTGPYELYSYNMGESVSNPEGGDKLDIGGDSDAGAAINDIDVSNSLKLLFMVTNTQQSGINHYFHVRDISNVRNISSAGSNVYNGSITDGYYVNMGIYYRESDNTVFLVGNDNDETSDFIILQPTYN